MRCQSIVFVHNLKILEKLLEIVNDYKLTGALVLFSKNYLTI